MKLRKEIGIRTYKRDGTIAEEILGLKREEFVLEILKRKIKQLRGLYNGRSPKTIVVPVWRYVGAWQEDPTLIEKDRT